MSGNFKNRTWKLPHINKNGRPNKDKPRMAQMLEEPITESEKELYFSATVESLSSLELQLQELQETNLTLLSSIQKNLEKPTKVTVKDKEYARKIVVEIQSKISKAKKIMQEAKAIISEWHGSVITEDQTSKERAQILDEKTPLFEAKLNAIEKCANELIMNSNVQKFLLTQKEIEKLQQKYQINKPNLTTTSSGSGTIKSGLPSPKSSPVTPKKSGLR